MCRLFSDDRRPLLSCDNVYQRYATNDVESLHEKKLYHLGEDRMLTTLLLGHEAQLPPRGHLLHHRPAQVFGAPEPAPEVDQFNVPQHAGAHEGEHHVRRLLPLNEEHCHLGFGGHGDPPRQSHLRGVHHLRDNLDGQAAVAAYARDLGHCSRRPGRPSSS